MTTSHRLLVAVSALFLPLAALAAPPADLTGRYVSLTGDRLEFTSTTGGTNGGSPMRQPPRSS